MSFVKLVEEKLKAKDYKNVATVLRDEKNKANLHADCMEIVSVLISHLTEETLRDDFTLFTACEDLLKIVAGKCIPQEVLFELLERIELTKNDDAFTSLLKVLQVVLLRLKENKARSLEWSLNSVSCYITGISLPDYMANITEEGEKLLESDETIRRILQLYITVLLFLEPIVQKFTSVPKEVFCKTGITRRNVVICFILQLMGNPLVFLDVHHSEGLNSNNATPVKFGDKTYTRQVAEELVSALMNLQGDPFHLLQYGERRARWPPKKARKTTGVFEEASRDIFMSDEKCPLLSLAMLCYLLFGENLSTSYPKVYLPQYIYEIGLYHCTQLMNHHQAVVHYKGILLARNLEKVLGDVKLKSDDLDLAIHQLFCTSLSKIIVYSSVERNRKEGTFLLRNYIYKFDADGRYLVIANLFKTVQHNGLLSFIATIYKDFIHKELNSTDSPNPRFTGHYLKHLLMNEICVLKKGIETDLVENSDTIISGLNILRFLLIRDKHNYTSIWSYIAEIDLNFLQPLRKSIDYARAHFKEEQSNVVARGEGSNHTDMDISIDILNGDNFPKLTKDKKLNLLAMALNNFDLMDCILARVVECMNAKPIHST
ncbi:glomulin-like isoform X1 [Topomyia yanbarensis]|uniref:glomulin-like isoform X1 n=1 Tax=Topomyia yanbarensis TaxID=2498891 RepID=UPI00273BA1A7|nr:glomulin-like isoform X1 [Topomyia yanbarensis]